MQRGESAEDRHGRQVEAFAKYPAWHTHTTPDLFWTASEKAGHALHANAPEGENRPEAQASHAVASDVAQPWSEKVLGPHEEHTLLLLAPSPAEKVPASHRLQFPTTEVAEL